MTVPHGSAFNAKKAAFDGFWMDLSIDDSHQKLARCDNQLTTPLTSVRAKMCAAAAESISLVQIFYVAAESEEREGERMACEQVQNRGAAGGCAGHAANVAGHSAGGWRAGGAAALKAQACACGAAGRGRGCWPQPIAAQSCAAKRQRCCYTGINCKADRRTGFSRHRGKGRAASYHAGSARMLGRWRAGGCASRKASSPSAAAWKRCC